MSVTGNFFSKLRSLAITLEKEAAQLEQAFNQEDCDYEDESPMRVLHDLRSEIIELKSDIQGTIEKNSRKGDELSNFLKICRVLQKRNASDIQQVKETFQKYGYKSPDAGTSDHELPGENPKPQGADKSPENTILTDLPPPAAPTLDKQTPWDLRAPQLSDFGLSHYQLPTVWEPPREKLPAKNVPEEKPKPVYRDIRTLNLAKTPKCALTMEEDTSQIQHFGISDYSTNLNDDYTIALINKKKGSATENCVKETSQNLKSMLATPAQLKYRNDFSNLDSPLPPIFCTPGLKVHRKGTRETSESLNHEERGNKCDPTAKEYVPSRTVTSLHALDTDSVDSPRPPSFCTPGLKVQKKEMSYLPEKPVEDRDADDLAVPPVPSFETKWLNTDPLARSLDITEPIPRPDLKHTAYLEQAAPPDFNAEKLGIFVKKSSPPKLREFPIGTPPRPEMTMCLTEDVFKYNIKPASPPKVLGYENMLWTPTRPEMTSCITDDVSQLLARYCDKTKPSWEDPQNMYVGKRNAENKENRP